MSDLYLGEKISKKHLDPKFGPKGKLFLRKRGWIRPYLSGDFYRRRNLSPIIGVIMYPSNNASIVLGYRRSIWENSWRVKPDDNRDTWRAPKELFWIGGKIVF